MPNFAWQNLIWIAIGGGLGAMARYLSTLAIHAAVPQFKPFGTMFVNVLGCLLVGLIMQIVIKSDAEGTPIHFFLVTGILGGFTTFSAFGYETMTLYSKNKPAGCYSTSAAIWPSACSRYSWAKSWLTGVS